MRRFQIEVAYDGTAYSGWQIQPNGMSVQQKLEEVIRGISGCNSRVHGSGRTDQGVHARGQVAHFDLETRMSAAGLWKAMNSLLPPDIRVNRLSLADDQFHARFSARAKEYRYFIWNGSILPPSIRLYYTHVQSRLDPQLMQKAAGYLKGKHDFTSFTANANRPLESAVRTLSALDVRKKGNRIVITAVGDGFLYKMVRSISGILIRVGEGAVPPSRVKEIMRSRNRTAVVPTAPPQGLFLWKVHY